MDLEWMNEAVPNLRHGNWMYSIICFLVGRRKKKLSYKEYMMLLYGLNRKTLGEEKSKENSIIRALELYKYHHNGKLPEMAEGESDDEQ